MVVWEIAAAESADRLEFRPDVPDGDPAGSRMLRRQRDRFKSILAERPFNEMEGFA